ncbi:hypothetical protein [Candidatus Cloacimonas acidaminovorans]|uniref:Uncharacterized protein n=1 Tax=Cloacimonas acidaminovorans (strain Evry) TaxID=459349 RepID=B0VHC4_CLOAI|nr:hypothetical protein [Candidatus Cloacimonas acidaminovorans]CAO80739.1 hypothetical protein CLOAM0858 [Candidatus Cloacimonas acidaminovorans str. Evry]
MIIYVCPKNNYKRTAIACSLCNFAKLLYYNIVTSSIHKIIVPNTITCYIYNYTKYASIPHTPNHKSISHCHFDNDEYFMLNA